MIEAAKRDPAATFAWAAPARDRTAGELFKSMAGVSMTHVPYKGNAPAVSDVMGGHVAMIFDGMAASLPNVRAGKLRGLAVTTLKRSSSMPERRRCPRPACPDSRSVRGSASAPAGTPPAVIAKLNAAIVPILRIRTSSS